MINILIIDTSGEKGSVAICADGRVIAEKVNTNSREQAGAINNMIAEVLSIADLEKEDLHAVSVCGGPGSYTGLRVSMATAKGLCFGLNIPLLQQNKLDILAFEHKAFLEEGASMIVLLKAREREYFVGGYTNEQPIKIFLQPILMSYDDVVSLVNTNNLSLIITENEDDKLIFEEKAGEKVRHIVKKEIDLNSWSTVVFDDYKCQRNVSLSYTQPFYLKEPYMGK